MDHIYLDNNATTPLLPAVWEAMRPYCLDFPGNPASSHHAGRQARKALEDARERIAQLLDAQPDEVLFTSGATEANNLALFGQCGNGPGRLFASPIEHPSVLEPIQRLASNGFTFSPLPVSHRGVVSLEGEMPADARLVAVMLANHETGVLQPIETLVSQVRGRAIFHCDAAAAAGKMAISFKRLGVTSLTVSAHKFHGPKGIGALLLKKNSPLRPQLLGGHQQRGKRPGTEPVFLAVGMTAALELALAQLEANTRKVVELRSRFLKNLQRDAAPLVVNGPEEGGLPHTANVSFPGCPADLLLMNIGLAGVDCSTGSACSSGSLLPSPVLQAMGIPTPVLHSALRFSLSHLLSMSDIDEAAARISLVVNRLRSK